MCAARFSIVQMGKYWECNMALLVTHSFSKEKLLVTYVALGRAHTPVEKKGEIQKHNQVISYCVSKEGIGRERNPRHLPKIGTPN
jgi:hypothetical protein